MHRFKEGDLAVTCNSRAPLVNDGHLVRIVAVIGPEPELGLEFGYFIERVDGQPFALACKSGSPMPVAGAVELFAEHSKLRPLSNRPLEAGAGTRNRGQSPIKAGLPGTARV